MIRIDGLFSHKCVLELIGILGEEYPISDKTIVFRPLKKDHIVVNGRKSNASITFSTTGDVPITICVGRTTSSIPFFRQAFSVAHEYIHALQIYRGRLTYQGHYD